MSRFQLFSERWGRALLYLLICAGLVLTAADRRGTLVALLIGIAVGLLTRDKR